MATITELKERTITETPLMLFESAMQTGAVERWSTHRVQLEGQTYEARVLRHNLFESRAGWDEGIDAISKISITLSNADSHFSQIERNSGWKGARITVRFVFFDLKRGEPASESKVLFRGIADAPDEITETTFRLSVMNSLSLQRLLLPAIRVQRRCPWKFPFDAGQRTEAATGGTREKYSPYFPCGYSPDIEGGCGNLNGIQPYEGCNGTRAECEERGMFGQDSAGRPTRRFAGIEFVPPTTLVRTHGDKAFHVSNPVTNEARYNDFVPLVYGTAWYAPPIVYAKNDGNLTRMEVLLGMGEIQGVLKVIVNDVEIPLGQSGQNMTATGWYNLFTTGARNGDFNPDCLDGSGAPAGDPYGGLAALSVVTPNAINDGRSLPRLEVLVQGMKLSQFDASGAPVGESFTNNPAWVLLDVLRRCGWALEDIDTASFADAAARCGEYIEARDTHGNPIYTPRFQCNLVLRRRRSAADLIRGIRCGSRLLLRYGPGGRLELNVEDSLARQQPTKPEASNSTASLDGGWAAYEFGDGSSEFSGILRKENGEPCVRVWCRSTAETPNHLTIEFQDEFNAYQQDSLSLTNGDDVIRTGQEVSAPMPGLGVPHFDQAARMLRFQLDRTVAGNTYIDFETSVRAIGLNPGDIITVTYLKEGFARQPFRVVRVAPGLNYRTVLLTAQIHDDEWYRDDNAQGLGYGDSRRPARAEMGIPRPISGLVWDEAGHAQFAISEEPFVAADGTGGIALTVGFAAPEKALPGNAGVPLVSLAAQVDCSSGTLPGGQALYYAVSALDSSGAESGLSFAVRATIPLGSDTNTVTLNALSFPRDTSGFRVYRGESPQALLRIAEVHPISTEFSDPGLLAELTPPPDPNYDHVNFYWRFELEPEATADETSANTIGNSQLKMTAEKYRGAAVRIVRGRGAGQERTVTTNSETTLTVAPQWSVVPDITSVFVVVGSGWQFGAAATASPARFQIPNQDNVGIEITGRSANAHDRECVPELSPLTRWHVLGSPGADSGVPGKPVFGLSPCGNGTVELAGIAFEDLVNTRTISSATLTLHYWNELNSPSPHRLMAAATAEDELIEIPGAGAGSALQIEAEVVVVQEAPDEGPVRVIRGAHGTSPAPHPAETPVYFLDRKVFVIPFARDFFGSDRSGDFSHAIFLPDARIASAEMVVTNCRGSSKVSTIDLTVLADYGLRTLFSGQLSLQVEGFLAIQANAVPPLIMPGEHSVRHVFAVVRDAPIGGAVDLRVRANGETYCLLTIPAGRTFSDMVNGFGLAPLGAETEVDLDIVSVPQGANTLPGRDLTVTIRL